MVALVAVVVAGVPDVAGARPAAAVGPRRRSCAGPLLTVSPGWVDRGGALLVRGEGFGTTCADVGPEPKGGRLGKPATGIVLRIEQGDRRVVVARGSADDAYRFATGITVPASMANGPAEVVATGPDGLRSGVTIGVSGELATEAHAGASTVARFGPANATAPHRTTSDLERVAHDSPTSVAVLAVLGGGAAAVAALGALARHRRRA